MKIFFSGLIVTMLVCSGTTAHSIGQAGVSKLRLFFGQQQQSILGTVGAAGTVVIPIANNPLSARADLSDGEKIWVAEHLNSPEGAKTLEVFKKPEEIVAAGLVKARVMDFEEAAKGVTEHAKLSMKIRFNNQEIERKAERAIENDRGERTAPLPASGATSTCKTLARAWRRGRT